MTPRIPNRRRAGQTLLFLAFSLVVLTLAVLWQFDIHKMLNVKARVRNGGDAAALAGARWQASSLNMVGHLNVMQAVALARALARGETTFPEAESIGEIQARLCFAGPMLGAAVVTAMQLLLSKATDVWQLYFGLLFVAVVSFAPRGLAGILSAVGDAWRRHGVRTLAPAAAVLLSFAAALVGLVLLVEVNWHFRAQPDKPLTWFRLVIDTRSPVPWMVALLLLGCGVHALRRGLAHWRQRFSTGAAR